MCLITEDMKSHKFRKDRIVYKKVKEDILRNVVSIVMDFRYYENIVYETTLKIESKTKHDDLEYGDLYSKQHYEHMSCKKISIANGFHSFFTQKRADLSYGFSIRKFLIPAGSVYYKDSTGMCVSNQIMLLPYGKDSKSGVRGRKNKHSK